MNALAEAFDDKVTMAQLKKVDLSESKDCAKADGVKWPDEPRNALGTAIQPFEVYSARTNKKGTYFPDMNDTADTIK
jgi:hypothetical protein